MNEQPENILVALPVHGDGLERLRAIAAASRRRCVIDQIDPVLDEAVWPGALIRDRTVLLTDYYAPPNLHEMEHLNWIQLASAGYEQLLNLPLQTMGVRVTNVSGVHDVPIAEWCLLMMLSFERNMPKMLRLQQDHHYSREVKFQAELRGRRIGILGYGNIGRETARVCRALGMEVWALSRGPIGPRPNRFSLPGTGDPEGVVPHRTFLLNQIEQFLPGLDYLIVTAALTQQTRGLLGERELRMLAPTTVILNPARADLINEAALRRALQDGWIAGAALDSHYCEPMQPDDPFWELPNVVLTPHVSGSGGSPYYLSRVWEIIALNVERYLQGQPLLDEVSWNDLSAY